MSSVVLTLVGDPTYKLAGRDMTEPFYIRLQGRLERIIKEYLNDYDEVQCRSGRTLGADTVWSAAISNMKNKYPDRVTFHLDIPTSEDLFDQLQDDDYLWKILDDKVDTKTVYGSIRPYQGSERKEMEKQLIEGCRRGMITSSDVLIAIYDGDDEGDTFEAIQLAEQMMKKLIIIHPSEV